MPEPVIAMSPWIEAQFDPIDEVLARLEAQPHRRFIKTHTPADGIPFFSGAKYVFVARDGRDAFMSMCRSTSAPADACSASAFPWPRSSSTSSTR